MKKIIAIFLAFIIIFSLIGCKTGQSLSFDDANSLIDKSYYNGIVFEEKDSSLKQNFAPFKQLARSSSSDEPSAILNRFSMLSKFKGDKSKSTVYINGERYKTGEVVPLSVLINTKDKNISACPTIVFIKHGEKSSTEIYHSIRINTDSLRVPHLKNKGVDAEFGDGYFAFSLFVASDEQNTIDCFGSPKELFSIDVAFHSAGHYTVAVVDSYKNNGKYSESLFLSGISKENN